MADDALDVTVIGRLLPDEASALAIGARDEDPIGHDGVHMRVEPRAVREALNLEEAAGLGLREADVVGPFSLPARELVGEDPEDGCGQVGTVCVARITTIVVVSLQQSPCVASDHVAGRMNTGRSMISRRALDDALVGSLDGGLPRAV